MNHEDARVAHGVARRRRRLDGARDPGVHRFQTELSTNRRTAPRREDVMTVEPMVSRPMTVDGSAEVHAVYAEGIRAGLVGAATIAVWFLLLDTIAGRPLYTPNVLGTALLRGVNALDDPARLPIDLET